MSEVAKLYIFNADNDLALASGLEFYTPPAAARHIMRDLALLPVWWADDGSYLLCDDATEEEKAWCREVSASLGKDVTIIGTRQLADIRAEVEPWGWNQALLRRLSHHKQLVLPSVAQVEKIRSLSHRRTSIAVNEAFAKHCAQLGAKGAVFAPRHYAIELSDIDAVTERVKAAPGSFVKAPWSNSGRGVIAVRDASQPTFRHWLTGILRQQGSVLVEHPLTAIQDFALEFRMEAGKAQLEGYSVFRNDSRHAFASSMVASSSALRSVVELYCDADLLVATTQRVLEEVLGSDYSGCLGIDMMVYHEGDDVRIYPCVELNLRRTMGHLTAKLGDTIIGPDTPAKRFVIEYSKDGFGDKNVTGTLLSPQPSGAHYRAVLESVSERLQ